MLDFFNHYPWMVKVLISIGLILVNIIVMRIVSKILFRAIKDHSMYYTVRKRMNYLFTFVMLTVVVLVWSGSQVDLATYVGFISAGIAISLREIFTNMVAWLIIIFQRPFEVGDRISIHQYSGDVMDIKLFQFVLMEVTAPSAGEQSTGRILHVPNNYIFLYGLLNANKGFEYIWHEVEVNVTPDSNHSELKTILESLALKHSQHLLEEAKNKVHEASKKYMIYYNNLTPIVYTHVKEGRIVMTMRFLIEPRTARMVENNIWIDLLEILNLQTDIRLI